MQLPLLYNVFEWQWQLHNVNELLRLQQCCGDGSVCKCLAHYSTNTDKFKNLDGLVALRAHVFVGSLTQKTERCAPPPKCSFAASLSSTKKCYYFSC
jgi:hypothetical protein